jgi:hypothetical protein
MRCPPSNLPIGANTRYRLAYSMTSFASASTEGGMTRPSALAVVRLTTISNLVGC